MGGGIGSCFSIKRAAMQYCPEALSKSCLDSAHAANRPHFCLTVLFELRADSSKTALTLLVIEQGCNEVRFVEVRP